MDKTELIEIIDSYYPPGIALNDARLKEEERYSRLINKCLEADSERGAWQELVTAIKAQTEAEISEFVLLKDYNPSFIAVILTSPYVRPKPDYEPCQLVLKVSAIAPVYALYFDNLSSDPDRRLIRCNAVSDQEAALYAFTRHAMTSHYAGFGQLEFSMLFHQLTQLDNISLANARKPYLDECIFGLYLSIHPYVYHRDKFNDEAL